MRAVSDTTEEIAKKCSFLLRCDKGRNNLKMPRKGLLERSKASYRCWWIEIFSIIRLILTQWYLQIVGMNLIEHLHKITEQHLITRLLEKTLESQTTFFSASASPQLWFLISYSSTVEFIKIWMKLHFVIFFPVFIHFQKFYPC